MRVMLRHRRSFMLLFGPMLLLSDLGATSQALSQARAATATTPNPFDAAVDNLIKKVSPSVVQVVVTAYAPLQDADRSNTAVVLGKQRASGSGFVIDSDGYIITNAHVVSGAQRVQVILPPSSSLDFPRRFDLHWLSFHQCPPDLPSAVARYFFK